MIDTISVALLIVAGIIGTAIAILLGWSESTEPLDLKKLTSSFIRGSIGIAIYIVGAYYIVPEVNAFDYIEVALFAAGFDAIIKRGQGALQNKLS
jgi:hypothetical protein